MESRRWSVAWPFQFRAQLRWSGNRIFPMQIVEKLFFPGGSTTPIIMNALDTPNDTPGSAQAHSTRIAFFIAGFGMAAWAPLVPFAKERLGIQEAALGTLLLCLGAGSII